MNTLIGDGQLVAIVLGVVLDEREDGGAVRGKIRNHVRLSDDDLPIQDVIVGVVATVDDERRVHHQTRGVALAVSAGIGFVGRHAVVGEKLRFAIAENDDASAGAFNVCCDVNPVEEVAQRMIMLGRWVVIMCGLWVYRNGIRQQWPVGVLGVFLAAVQEGENRY